MANTLTYKDGTKGWTSFYSYNPEKMVGMNNRFYSFKGGKLYMHHSENVPRNNFYGVQHTSKLTGVINDDPSSVKTFKTFVLESNKSWDANFYTDLGSGEIKKDWFKLKEGDYFGHIRRNELDNSFEMRSAQGLGVFDQVVLSSADVAEFSFGFSIDSQLSVGDKIYAKDGNTVFLVGTVLAKDVSSLTVDTSFGTVPSSELFLLYIKNAVAESSGTTGYFLRFEIENDSTDYVEIFSVGSSLFKSSQ